MDTLANLLKNSPDQIIALAAVCALVVSFLSILLTMYTAWLQRQHNFKSLTPVATVMISDYENQLEVKIRNTGVGPLIIDAVSASDGKSEKDNLISWMPPLPKEIYWDTFADNLGGWCITPDHDVILIQLEGSSSDEQFASFRDEVRQRLSQLTVKVEYRDIYNRKMPVNHKHLKWFGRHFMEVESKNV